MTMDRKWDCTKCASACAYRSCDTNSPGHCWSQGCLVPGQSGKLTCHTDALGEEAVTSHFTSHPLEKTEDPLVECCSGFSAVLFENLSTISGITCASWWTAVSTSSLRIFSH